MSLKKTELQQLPAEPKPKLCICGYKPHFGPCIFGDEWMK